MIRYKKQARFARERKKRIFNEDLLIFHQALSGLFHN